MTTDANESNRKAILLDMDGVLYNSSAQIPGAAETLAWIRKQNIPHLFVTNTSARSREELVAKLARFGISATREQIFTPAFAAAGWLRSQPRGEIALFVTRHTGESDFADFPLLPEPAETGARYVIIGDLGSRWDFATLNRAFRLLHSAPESQLIALGLTRYWQADDGLRLDVAPFVAALENATQRKATVFGKPERSFFQAACNHLGVPVENIWMIGDDIAIDVEGAQRAGLKGALVRTGKFREPDLSGSIQPDAVLDSIADVSRWWETL